MEEKRSQDGAVDQSILDEAIVRRNALFDIYIKPNINLVYSLCIRYSSDPSYVQDNYVEVLANFYKYIDTYNPERSISTWIHIVTKRYVINADSDRINRRSDDVDIVDMSESALDEDEVSSNCMGMENYRQLYGDEVLNALDSIKPIYRDALLLQQAGYKLNEIVDICFENGTLKTKNIETVKSRLFLAKQQMRKLIDRDGEKRAAA